jgi:phage terminase small subunit
MAKSKLNIRQKRFIDNLFEGKSQKDAYIAAGYKARGHSAESEATQLMRNNEIINEISRRLNDINAKNKVRLGRISEVALSEALKIIKDPLVDPKIKVDAIKDILDRVGLKTTENINLKLSGELKVTDAREKILSRLNGLTSRKGKKRDNKQPK